MRVMVVIFTAMTLCMGTASADSLSLYGDKLLTDVCNSLQMGATVPMVGYDLMEQGFSPEVAAQWVWRAVETRCPWLSQRVNEEVDAYNAAVRQTTIT